MKTIEFQARVKEGKIEIPSQYAREISERVHVILLVEEQAETTGDFIDYLLAHPVRVKGFRPLTREEIYAERVY